MKAGAEVHVSTYRDEWHAPSARYAVHRNGYAPKPFRRLAEAKAFVVTHYGPQKWERREVPDGRRVRVEWWPEAVVARPGTTAP